MSLVLEELTPQIGKPSEQAGALKHTLALGVEEDPRKLPIWLI